MFIEQRLLDCVAYGSEFGHVFKTRIVTLESGHERRASLWSLPLGRYSIRYNLIKDEHHQAVRHAHLVCRGAAIAFRFKDWVDYRADNEPLGVADGSLQTFQLNKGYPFGGQTLHKPIKKPVSVQIFGNAHPIPATIDYTSGQVQLTAPAGSVLTWSGEFDIPVRFASDRLDLEPVTHQGGQFLLATDVELIEVRQ
ncbi:hypothetical protein AXE65_08830 [Ventosimonas gracilis]|uniref:DUF2460 domain-containing protein n=2 Tax=Ventosimonas gracilis TaxID=1680762 RepID=A0A139SXN6_9GAMM|nr:hypothetical protein AXE65_08830 [Ventosimonas gracilis]